MLCKVQYSTKPAHLQGLFCTSVLPFLHVLDKRQLSPTAVWYFSTRCRSFFARLGEKNDRSGLKCALLIT